MKNIDLTACIHHLAHVEDCVIGKYCRVWQFASVIRSAKLGDYTKVASCAIVDGARVGQRCIISHGAFIDPGIEIGNDVFIGPQVTLCNDYWPRVSKEGWHTMPELISGAITVSRIEDGASIGANTVILPGITIGAGAMVAAGATVDRDVPALTLFRRDCSIVAIDPKRDPRRARQV